MVAILTTILTLTAGLAAASPASISSRRDPRESQVGGITLCAEPHTQGFCNYQVYQLNKCYDITGPFENNLKTFAMDQEAFFCYIYSDPCHDGDGWCGPDDGKPGHGKCKMGPLDHGDPKTFDVSNPEYLKSAPKSFKCFQGE
ncbi:hypothetical protein QBC44DRAFT_381532 [Cladorrhinum sp. PSN332]|nr:hypothetical protein QBC44DRAFT_381532 [Cladorrhinum sp. PSN332]